MMNFCHREKRRDVVTAWRTSTSATGLLRHGVPRNDKVEEKLHVSKLAFMALCALAICTAHAQPQWPAKPVRIIVPSSPGGGTDTIARLLGAHFAAALGQQFVIDNRAGAAGLIGYQIAARTAGDGYTLLLAPTTITTIPLVVKNPQYDPLKDFAPITQVVASTQVLVVHPSLPAKSVRDLAALSKKTGDLTFASPGDGSVPHLAM